MEHKHTHTQIANIFTASHNRLEIDGEEMFVSFFLYVGCVVCCVLRWPIYC